VVPPGHPLTAHATTVLAECALYPLILPAPALPIRAILDGAFGRSAIRASPVVESTSTALMRQLVMRGEGIAFLNRFDIEEERRDGRLAFVPLRDAALRPQTLTLVTRAASPPSPAVRLLADEVVACLGALQAP
jgi:DNA-binding transcriptional LysR family regulator